MAALFRMTCLALCFGMALAFSLPHRQATAGLFGDSELDKAQEGAEKDVRSLLEITVKPELPFHYTRARKLLAFVSLAKESPAEITPAELDGAEGAYWEFDLPMPLSKVATYLYNPEVPSHAVYPGAVRMGGWLQPKVARAGLKPLWSALPGRDNPVVVRGMEYEATTPDPNSGTYFSYELKRLVTGYKDGETPVIISVATMDGDSDIGKKGVAFGPPQDWLFFYSGIKGNLLSGVGWAESRMYASSSVFVFRQVGPNTTRASLFKWVRAGWKGMNMVKSKHILSGVQSFAKNVREVLGAPTLPSSDKIAAETTAIASQSAEEMRARLAPLEDMLQKSVQNNDDLQREEFQPLVSGGYLQSLNREELAAELVKDYIRRALKRKAFVSPTK